jgi:N-acetylglutamate synthase-like GNAT family acetyltransferase
MLERFPTAMTIISSQFEPEREPPRIVGEVPGSLGCGQVAHIEFVRVSAALRGQRIGERMMRWAIEHARSRGCVRVQLDTNHARADAHRFYERLGFKATHAGMKLFLWGLSKKIQELTVIGAAFRMTAGARKSRFLTLAATRPRFWLVASGDPGRTALTPRIRGRVPTFCEERP